MAEKDSTDKDRIDALLLDPNDFKDEAPSDFLAYMEWVKPELDELHFDLESWRKPSLKNLVKTQVTFDKVTEAMDEIAKASDFTTQALIEYMQADVEFTRKLIMIPRQRGRQAFHGWIDEWANWEFELFPDVVEVNGIKMPRDIPREKPIEPPKFNIRKQRGRETFSLVNGFRRFITVEKPPSSTVDLPKKLTTQPMGEPPITKQRRRRDGGGGPWFAQKTSPQIKRKL